MPAYSNRAQAALLKAVRPSTDDDLTLAQPR